MSTVLVIHAHPDDETFANAGRIGQLVGGGYRVVCVIATGGEAGELANAGDLETARARRLAKYERALAVLGVAEWRWLEPRAEWVDAPDGPQVADAEPDRLKPAVNRLLDVHAPQMVLTVGRDGLTGHPDHVAIGQAVADAVRGRDLAGGAWGARLTAESVAAGERLARSFAGARPVGSGRVKGSDAQLVTFDVLDQQTARRAALDSYHDGLGTTDLHDLIASASHVGDSILLRAVIDAEGWRSEHYERLDTAP